MRSGVAAVLAAWGLVCTAAAQPLPLVDVHAHFQPPRRAFDLPRDRALATMEKLGIERTVLMPPPQVPQTPSNLWYDAEELLAAVKAHPGRFAVLGGSSLNRMIHGTPPDKVDDAARARFRERATELLAKGAVGFGEIAVLHLSLPIMGSQHPYERVEADHPLLLLLADIAGEHDVPIDLHCDLVPEDMPLPDVLRPNPSNPPTLQSNIEGLRKLLAHNRKARIIWSHVGFEPLLTRGPQRVRALLEAHPNLSMSFRLQRGGPPPGAALDGTGKVKPGWVALLSDFPDRFLLGSDSFYDDGGIARGSSEEALGNLRALVEQLPPEVGRKIARDNAVRLFKLQ